MIPSTLELFIVDFPKRLAALRKECRLTQQALANAVHVHITQINRYEAGETQPTLEVIRKLAVALSVSADMLIFDKDERGPDDRLRFQFETLNQFDEDDKQVAEDVLEGLILKHQAKQSLQRRTATKKANRN